MIGVRDVWEKGCRVMKNGVCMCVCVCVYVGL